MWCFLQVVLKPAVYTVGVVCGSGADMTVPFDGDAFLTLYGDDGTTAELQLLTPSAAAAAAAPTPSTSAPPEAPTPVEGSPAAETVAAAGIVSAGSTRLTLTPGATVAAVARGVDVGVLRNAQLRLDMSGACKQVSRRSRLVALEQWVGTVAASKCMLTSSMSGLAPVSVYVAARLVLHSCA